MLAIQEQLKKEAEIVELLKTTKLSPARIAKRFAVSVFLVEALSERKPLPKKKRTR